MKEISEIRKELRDVEFYLRSSDKKEHYKRWEGYRDALLWILGEEKK